MSRPLRIEYEGAWYHVMNRGAARREIYPSERAYRLFLAGVSEASRRFALAVHGYCLMPNHYHLLIRTPLANLGRAMRHIDGVYTQRHNRLLETDGPLFRGRYKAITVDADAYLLQVSRYIHRNPIEGKTPLVDRLEAWRWSSYPDYIGQREPADWLYREAIYAAFGNERPERHYRAFVAAGVDRELAAFYDKPRRPPVLGHEEFRARILSKAHAISEVAGYEHRILRDPEHVIAATAAHFNVPIEQLSRRGRLEPEAAWARSVAMWLCQECTGLTLREIGSRFGDIGYSAVAQRISRLRAQMDAEALEPLKHTVM